MRVKIQSERDIGLCATCREAQVFEQDHDLTIICNSRRAFRVLRKVTYCTDYDDRGTPYKHDMERIAWMVTTDKSGMAIGFKPPVRRKDED